MKTSNKLKVVDSKKMAKKNGKRGNLKSMLKQHSIENKKYQMLSKKKENIANLEKLKKNKITGNKKNVASLQKHKDTDLIVPFSTPNDVLFLIGEGDFSYTRSLIESGYHKDPTKIIATSFDNSIKELKLKYPTTFEENYKFLTDKGVRIMLSIDATDLIKSLKISNRSGVNKILQVENIDCIIFNFPHTGAGVKDMERNILHHQKLLNGFFKSSAEFIKLFDKYNANKCTDSYAMSYKKVVGNNKDDTLNKCRLAVSIFKGLPYDNWQLKKLANTNGWKTLTTFKFEWDNFKEYQHRRTNSEMSTTKDFKERDARVHLFDRLGLPQHQKNDKKGSDEESEYEE